MSLVMQVSRHAQPQGEAAAPAAARVRRLTARTRCSTKAFRDALTVNDQTQLVMHRIQHGSSLSRGEAPPPAETRRAARPHTESIASVAMPNLVSVAETVKTRFLGAAPGHTFVEADKRLADSDAPAKPPS